MLVLVITIIIKRIIYISDVCVCVCWPISVIRKKSAKVLGTFVFYGFVQTADICMLHHFVTYQFQISNVRCWCIYLFRFCCHAECDLPFTLDFRYLSIADFTEPQQVVEHMHASYTFSVHFTIYVRIIDSMLFEAYEMPFSCLKIFFNFTNTEWCQHGAHNGKFVSLRALTLISTSTLKSAHTHTHTNYRNTNLKYKINKLDPSSSMQK